MRAGVVGRHGRGDRRGRHRRSPTSPTSPACRRCSTTASSRCTRRCTAGSSPTAASRRTAPTSSSYGIEPFDLVVSNLYPFREQPDIETDRHRRPDDDPRRGEEPRVGRDRHRARRSTTPCSTSSRATTARVGDDTRRTLALEAFARTAAYDAAIVAWLQTATSRCPQHLALALERTDETLRYGENPHQHGARYRVGGTTSWWDDVRAAQRPRALVPQPLRRRRRVAARARPRRPARPRRHHQARQPVRRRGRRRPRRPRTSARSSATSARRSAASSRSTARSTPRPSSAMVAGPQADVVIAPGYEPRHDRRAHREAQEHPAARGAGRPSAPALDFRQISGGFLVQDAAPLRRRRATTGGSSPSVAPTDERVARRRARVAHLRAREVERDRAREGRPGRRHRRRAAEPGRVGRDRGEEGRGPGGRAARARATRSTRSPTASRPRPRPGVAVVVQPGGAMRDEQIIERADELGLAMVFTGERHFLH